MHKNQSFIQSAGNAFKGLITTVREHKNFRIMVAIAIIVIAAGFYFGLTRFEWAVIWICIAMVLCLELINSALEETLDHLHPGRHESVGKAKDMAAGAVILASIISVIAGIYIFYPRIFL